MVLPFKWKTFNTGQTWRNTVFLRGAKVLRLRGNNFNKGSLKKAWVTGKLVLKACIFHVFGFKFVWKSNGVKHRELT